MFDVLSRLKELQDAKGVSSYRLAKISDTPKSTLAGWRSASRAPGIKKLEQICTEVLGISLAQFFDTDNRLGLTPAETLLLGNYRKLSPEVQKVLELHAEQLAAVPACCAAPAEGSGSGRTPDLTSAAASPAIPGREAPPKSPSVLKVAEKAASPRSAEPGNPGAASSGPGSKSKI